MGALVYHLCHVSWIYNTLVLFGMTDVRGYELLANYASCNHGCLVCTRPVMTDGHFCVEHSVMVRDKADCGDGDAVKLL